ncbi:phospholipase D-like domain-containing protein [Virgibacillus senegalensis]|uniref:phospholipase D-like domain-containing protein n=1 Tax=Virgibacillus senegalensis TaxID=1499679 RepID=UPI00069F8FF0|nr:phospholipase D-like domain-containing protein [Virgibacillus senegalensis]
MNTLQDKVVHFVFVCTHNYDDYLLDRLINVLSKVDVKNGIGSIQSVLNFPFDLEYLLFEILGEVYKKELRTSDLINALEIARRMAKYQIASQPRIIPVWTGPAFDRSLTPFKTYETVKQLIDSAKDEIFIVGYNFSFRYEIIRELLGSIEKAAERKCRINLIVNNEESNYREIMSNWNKESYLLNIYSWIGTPEEDYASLHAKLVIIDQQKMLLTSANFSYHGFKKNIETGVVIENHEVTRSIWKQYQSLLRNNEMKKVY